MPTIPRARWRDLPTPIAIVVTVFALLALAGLVGKIHTAPAAAVQPTPGLIILIATPVPAVPLVAPVQPAQQVAVQIPAAPRYVVAFASPDIASVLGSIPMPDAAAITG
jgi:hypothetical protein